MPTANPPVRMPVPPISQATIANPNPGKPFKNKLSLQVLLFEELRRQFQTKEGWVCPAENPFLERNPTSFDAVYQVGGKNVGCRVKKQSKSIEFAIIASDKESLKALSKCVMAYKTACTTWQNRSPDNKDAKIYYTLTVDSLDEIKPILEVLTRICSVKEVYIRDKNDENKTSPVSAEKMKEIRDDIDKALKKGQPHASKARNP